MPPTLGDIRRQTRAAKKVIRDLHWDRDALTLIAALA